jgi:DNA-binding CsgD family transcriptional regulator
MIVILTDISTRAHAVGVQYRKIVPLTSTFLGFPLKLGAKFADDLNVACFGLFGGLVLDKCPNPHCAVCRIAHRYQLTPREVQVIALLGLKNKAMARALGCSTKTVAKHVEHISRKTGAESKLEIGVWAISKGLVRV